MRARGEDLIFLKGQRFDQVISFVVRIREVPDSNLCRNTFILSEDISDVPQRVQTNAGSVFQIMHRLLPSTFLSIYYLVTILLLGSMYFEIRTALLNK
jgi:hypothetical protein